MDFPNKCRIPLASCIAFLLMKFHKKIFSSQSTTTSISAEKWESEISTLSNLVNFLFPKLLKTIKSSPE